MQWLRKIRKNAVQKYCLTEESIVYKAITENWCWAGINNQKTLRLETESRKFLHFKTPGYLLSCQNFFITYHVFQNFKYQKDGVISVSLKLFR